MATSHAAAIAETIVGSHIMKIDGFSGTKDFGIGKCIKSITFSVGGQGWYIKCYPCGVDEKSAGWVSLFLCLSANDEQVEAKCRFFFFTLVDGDDGNYHLATYKHTYNAETSWRRGGNVIEREELESLLRDDCFQIICDVYLHQPLSSGELFTAHRGIQVQGPSAHLAASPTTENVAGSHVLTIEGYSNMKNLSGLYPGNIFFETESFHVGGQRWQIELYPSGHKEIDATNCLAVFTKHYEYKAVKVRVELTLLTLAREIIASTQFCYAFTRTKDRCCCYFPFTAEPESSSLLFGDSFHVKYDVTIIKEITPMRPPDLHLDFGNLLASQVGTDVEFEVGGDLFSAHKCVLATRSTAFMAEFFGPAGSGSSTTTVTRVHVNDMEPRVFKALLHFIYNDTVPEVPEDDKVRMAQGLLVAADRYAMERLKLICGDMLCNYMNDARTAVDTLELADKHGCRRLKEKCMKLLKGHFAKVAP